MKFTQLADYKAAKEQLMANVGAINDNQLSIFLGYTSNANIAGWNKDLRIPDSVLRKYSDTNKNTNIPQSSNSYQLQKLTCKASAGGGNSLDNIEVFNTGEYMSIDRAFFKTPPKENIKVIQVDGYSMVPVLLPDSWVIFEECPKFKTDGLYIVNYGNELMVKLLQMHPNGKLEIVSANKDYKSYEIDLRDNQEHFRIVGKVIRSII